MRGQCRYLFLFFLWSPVASASAPEGLKSFIVDIRKTQSPRLTLLLQNTESLWRSEGPSANLILDFSAAALNLFTMANFRL